MGKNAPAQHQFALSRTRDIPLTAAVRIRLATTATNALLSADGANVTRVEKRNAATVRPRTNPTVSADANLARQAKPADAIP